MLPDAKLVCHWCEMKLPKTPFVAIDGGWFGTGGVFCSKQCYADSTKNAWPSWMTGRIGIGLKMDWYKAHGFLYVSAPNGFRQIFRKKGDYKTKQTLIVEKQIEEFPHLPNAMGLDIDPLSWDQILVWKN